MLSVATLVFYLAELGDGTHYDEKETKHSRSKVTVEEVPLIIVWNRTSCTVDEFWCGRSEARNKVEYERDNQNEDVNESRRPNVTEHVDYRDEREARSDCRYCEPCPIFQVMSPN